MNIRLEGKKEVLIYNFLNLLTKRAASRQVSPFTRAHIISHTFATIYTTAQSVHATLLLPSALTFPAMSFSPSLSV